ncbi:MAG: hypothetical protein M3Z22_06565 [Verrucomicrobiota bacterium]|nr:hypothetical protein [Verrucomicrobiota bacterium]
MRLLLEVLVAALLVMVAWETPYKARIMPAPEAHRVRAAPPVRQATAASTSGSWMWDKNRHTPLDRGAYDQKFDVARPPSLNNPTGGIYLEQDRTTQVDERGRHYWTDQSGARHYY